MKNGKILIWMNLLGFERNDPDRGVERYLNQTGFVPDGICALLFHADFFHQHRGMDEEYTLPPDNCAYWGCPRNFERERQPWTNHDLRTLSVNLKKRGTGLYASIMGDVMSNAFHYEWINAHPEVCRHVLDPKKVGEPGEGHFVLKRFSDGSYYEDFFIDKVCETLVDYELKGIHLADQFFPSGPIYNRDYSSDFVRQFLEYSGAELPANVAATLGNDDKASEYLRHDWIYKHLREEWINFHVWRWEKFIKKLCDRVHAIGKEVLVLGMYCTDPFETLYCLGTDMRRIVNAGVDYVTANIVSISQSMRKREYRFERFMAMIPTLAAYIPKGHLLSMLAVQDATEEWSTLHHSPCMHERDNYTMMAYQLIDDDGISRALDGFYICLGDGIPRSDWQWELDRFEISMALDAKEVISPSMYWSDYAHDRMVHEYIHTRRWTPFKQFYELAKAGTYCAATVRPEGLANYSGTLFVPNFDMLSPEEQKEIISYDRGSVLCTANPGFDPKAYGIDSEIIFEDRFSTYPMTAFAFGCAASQELRDELDALLSEDDGVPNLDCAPEDAPEFDNMLHDTLIYAKATTGFRDACAKLLLAITDSPFEVNKPYMAFRREDGAYRLYLFNDHRERYRTAFVIAKSKVEDVKVVSKFPILPPRYRDSGDGDYRHNFDEKKQSKQKFEVKIQPGGVTIVDVYFK